MTTFSHPPVPEPEGGVQPLRRWTGRAGALGAGVWAITMAVVRPSPVDWADATAWFGAMVIVPMILHVTAPRDMLAPGAATWRFAVRAHPVAASLLGAALLIPAGVVAGLLSLPWLIVTGAIAASGLARLVAAGANGVTSAALMGSAIGAAWLSAFAFGWIAATPTARGYVMFVGSLAWVAPIALDHHSRRVSPSATSLPALALGGTIVGMLAGIGGVSILRPPAVLSVVLITVALTAAGWPLLKERQLADWTGRIRALTGGLWIVHAAVVVVCVIAGMSGATAWVGGEWVTGFALLGAVGALVFGSDVGEIEND